MLHMNKTPKYQNLYNMLVSIYRAPTQSYLDYSIGVYTGWTCAKFPVDFDSDGLNRLDKLVKEIEKDKTNELEEM